MENRRAGLGGVFLICPALRVCAKKGLSGCSLCACKRFVFRKKVLDKGADKCIM